MLSRPADARVRARFRVGAKRGVFRGENGGGAGVFCTMAFGGKGWKAGGKTRKIRPSGGNLCSFRDVAGRSVQDCGKVVQKLAGREDENHKLCTTLCAPLRLGTRIVQVSFPLGVRCVGVAVRRCAIRSFSLPPAEAGCPFRRRRRGTARGGSAVGGQVRSTTRGGVRLCLRLPPPLRTVIRYTSGFTRHTGGMVRHTGSIGRHTGSIVRHTSDIVRHTSDIVRHTGDIVRHTGDIVRHTGSMVRHCTRVHPPLPSTLPHPAHGGAGHGGTTARGRSLYIARANPILLYIRVRRREGENVLHRAASNDVDNFSVDNPLWITVAAGGRLLRGRRRRLCGGSVNAGTAFRSRGCDFTARTGGRIYNNTRARVLLRRMCVKPADLTTHSPSKTFAHPRTATRPPRTLPLPHAVPTHARRLRDAFPTDLTTHSPPKTSPRPHTATRLSRALPLPHAAPTHARRLHDARPQCAMHSPLPSQLIPRRKPPHAHAQRHALPEHFLSPPQP